MNWRSVVKRILAPMLVMVIAWSLVSCSQPEGVARKSLISRSAKLAEIAPPATIQELRQFTDVYQPQVKILSPRSGEVLQDTTVSVKLQVNDLPLFKDEELELGPHLHFIVDNQPYEAIYRVDEPIVLNDLAPGSHTLRVFASRPWHESYKNEGAYDQVTFHLFAKTPDNSPDPAKPLLTYSRPKATYGAEPVMLDFYLRNAPLHFIAQENSTDAIPDWKIRCTVNGESFTFDRWEPLYLEGLKPGKNWIQLELLDENGNPFSNAYNNTVRLITYEPNGTDALSRLTRGEIPITIARRLIDPNYVPPAPEPETLDLEAPEELLQDAEETAEPIVPLVPEEAPSLSPDEVPTAEEPIELEPPIEVREAPVQIPELDQELTDGQQTDQGVSDKAKEEFVEEVQQQLEQGGSEAADRPTDQPSPPVLVAPEVPQPIEEIAPIAPAAPEPPAQPKSRFKQFLNSAKEKAGQVRNQAKDTMGRLRKPAEADKSTQFTPTEMPQAPEVPDVIEAPESVEIEPSLQEPPAQLPESATPETLPEILDEPTIEDAIPDQPPPAAPRSPVAVPRLLLLHP